MSVKRLFIRIACAGACILAASLQSVAQSPPTDSLVFDTVTAAIGQPLELNARFMNNQALHVLALPLVYPADVMTLDSVAWVSERVQDLPFLTWEADREAGSVYLYVGATEEPYIAPGRDTLARLYFTAHADAPDGSTAILDTTNSSVERPLILRSTDMVDLPLFFARGVVEMYQPNRPPTMQVQKQQYVSEGEQLAFAVTVDDADGDPVTFAAAGAPTTAVLTEMTDGEYMFTWTPDFAGPFSSVASPFKVTFLAADGESSVTEEVLIWVGNSNRPPELTLPAAVTSTIRDTVKVVIGAIDPDADPLSFYVLDDLDGDTILGNNPWTFHWTPERADIGRHNVRFVCADDYGAADTVAVSVTIQSVVAQRLAVEYIEVPSGSIAEVAVSLFTLDAIGGADLLINYDPSALTFHGVDRAGGGMESWEYFDVSDGKAMIGRNVHIVGFADLDNGIPAPALPPSDTVLFTLQFNVSSDVQFFDLAIPLTFPLMSDQDNILSTDNSETIFQDDIEYSPGGILIQKPLGYLIGDINLNGVAFEIGDAVRLLNYFIYGASSALNPVQTANSDCNQDGLPATAADLVYLIRILTEEE